MLEAKLMYLGGIVVKATDELDYADYINYGFRCIVCGEEVFLRKGSERQAHFAHHRYSPNSSAKCSLRLTQFSTTSSPLYILNWENKNQRIKIYQENLLNIISQSYPDFYQNSDQVKNTLSESKLITQCESFHHHKDELLQDIDVKKDYLQSIKITQKLATKEVIDYLTLKHTLHLLKSVTAYSISQVEISNNSLNYIPWKTKEILLSTDWLYYLVKIVDGSFFWSSEFKSNAEAKKVFKDNLIKSEQSSVQKAFVGYVELNEFFTIRYLKLKDGTRCVEISEIYKILPHIFKQGQELENLKTIMNEDFSFSQCIIAINSQEVDIIYIRQLRKIINNLARRGDFQAQMLKQYFDKPYTNLGQLFKEG